MTSWSGYRKGGLFRNKHPRKSAMRRVRGAFSRGDLRRVCEMNERGFGDAYQMDKVVVGVNRWSNDDDGTYYYFKDNGSNILAVAHLDTVVARDRRKTTFVDTDAGPVVHSGALDDRLGAYTILELLPKLGLKFDWLLTTGEESGASTAEHFDAPPGKVYNWIIEFDRGGTDTVLYEYEDVMLTEMVEEAGVVVGTGAFSDISYMEHVGVKAMNWGIGYRDYHSVRGYAFLNDTFEMIAHFLKFHEMFKDEHLPHEQRWSWSMKGRGSHARWGYGESSQEWETWEEKKARLDGLVESGVVDAETVAEVLDAEAIEIEPTTEQRRADARAAFEDTLRCEHCGRGVKEAPDSIGASYVHLDSFIYCATGQNGEKATPQIGTPLVEEPVADAG